MFDIIALAAAILLIVVASRPDVRILVGKHHRTEASKTFRFVVLFPLGATISIIALARLIGRVEPDVCHRCSRVGYSLIAEPYVGWVFTFIGLLGLKSFARIRSALNRAFVIIAIICGPLLMSVGLFVIIQRLRE